MTDEAKLAEQVGRAQRAKAILEDPLFAAAMAAEQNEIVTAFQRAAWSDADGLRALKIRHDATESLFRRLRAHMKTGTFAMQELTRLQKAREAINRIRRVA